MRALQLTHVGIDGSDTRRFTSAFSAAVSRMVGSFAAAMFGPASVENIIASQYEGRSWCDATERELTDDIVSRR
jgi:hypothetical protein